MIEKIKLSDINIRVGSVEADLARKINEVIMEVNKLLDIISSSTDDYLPTPK